MAKSECAICEEERYLVVCSSCTLDQDRRASKDGARIKELTAELEELRKQIAREGLADEG